MVICTRALRHKASILLWIERAHAEQCLPDQATQGTMGASDRVRAERVCIRRHARKEDERAHVVQGSAT
jgi:hypothetical protein